MRFQLLFILILTIFLSCEEKNTSENQSKSTTDAPSKSFLKYNLSIVKTPNDTLKVKLKSGQLCLNENIDSLSQLSIGKYDDLHIVDVDNSVLLLCWNPLIGRLKISKLSDKKYKFTGMSYLPDRGDWSKDFNEHIVIEYILEIYENSYTFYRNKDINIQLEYDETDIRKFKKYIESHSICKSEDWEKVVVECFDKIQKYEYSLFASIFSSKKSYLDTYLNLRDDISICNAGQFSEHIGGNEILLYLLGITEPTYEFGCLGTGYNYPSKRYCYE